MKCKYYKKCSGCQLQNLDYPEQLKYKQKQLNTLLSKYGRVERIIPMEHPFNYRNKMQCAFYYDTRQKRLASGVYQSTRGSVVSVDYCMIEDEECQEIARTVTKLCTSFKLKAFDERKGSGFVRHLLIRKGFKTGEVMLVIVTAGVNLPKKTSFVNAVIKAHPSVKTIVQNVNPDGINLTLGERSFVLYGSGYIEDELCGCRFRISPESFYQVNPTQCEILYNTALKLAEIKDTDRVFDAYCGTGTIGIIASKNAGEVLGVELNAAAVYDAVKNAKNNGANNIYFECADAGDYITELTKAGEKFDVVILDPPRAGATVRFLKALCKMKSDRIVYISCNPQTLARDLNFITTHGYRAKKTQPVDMFPHTKHMECVVLLSKN